MTNQEWKKRCVARIFAAVQKAGRIRIRDLKRATHYNRGPEDESIPLWYEALDYLDEKAKRVVIERDEYDNALFVMTLAAAAALKEVTGVRQAKQVSPLADTELSD